MTISYPLTMPTAPGPKRVEFQAVNSIGIVRSPYTYRRQVQNFKAGAWGAVITLPELEQDTAAEWTAFLVALRGGYGTFYLGDPMRKTPRGTALGAPLVKGANQLGTVLEIDGAAPSITNWLRKDDKIQVANRMHMVLNDADSDGSGNVTLDIWPEILISPPDNDPITTNEPKGVFCLAQNLVPICSADESKTYEVSFTAVEAL